MFMKIPNNIVIFQDDKRGYAKGFKKAMTSQSCHPGSLSYPEI